ncbi:hypothetical protein ABPG74_022180 [Tetrahymena malaccensis]
MSSQYETENNTIQPEKSNFTSVNSDTSQQQCRAYIVMLKKTIKELHSMLKIRLRVEFPDSIQTLNQLNEKLLSFSEIGTEVENLYSDLLEQSKIYKEGLQKAQKYDKLVIRLQEIEQAYKQQNEELMQKTKQLEEDSQEKQQKITQISSELIQKMEEASNFKIKCETIENDLKLKVSEINRITIERDNIKRQSQNLNSLLKQVNEEKEVKTQKMQSMVEEKIEDLKEELNRVKDYYQKKIFDKDNMIEKLERELQLTKKELELNAEFTFLQSSMSNSAFQSYNTQNVFQTQHNQKSHNSSNAPLPKNSQPSSTKNKKEENFQTDYTSKQKQQQLGSQRQIDKQFIGDDLDEEIEAFSAKQQIKKNQQIEQTEQTDRSRQTQITSKLESPFTRHSTKEDNALRTSREGKIMNISSIQNNNQFQEEEDEDTLAQLSDNSEEYNEKKQFGAQFQQQNLNNSLKKQQKNTLNTSRSSAQNEISKQIKNQQNDHSDLDQEEEDDEEDVQANIKFKQNKQKNFNDDSDQEEGNQEYDDDQEEGNDEDDYQNHLEIKNNHKNQIQQKDQQFLQKQLQDLSSNEEDNSISGEINVNDEEFSENDSIDQEVKRRLQIKQSEIKNKKQIDNQKNILSTNRSFDSSSNKQSNYSTYQPQKISKFEDHDLKNEIQSKNSQQNINSHKRNLSHERQNSELDSDESMVRNAEQIRAIQKKKNQEKFEENKKKLMLSKKQSQEQDQTSEDD